MLMPDRSSHQGLPDEWNHGSHAAHGPFSVDGTSDGHGAGTGGAHRARTADGHGTGPIDSYSTVPADALGARPDPFGTQTFGAQTDAVKIRPEPFGGGTTDPFAAAAIDAYAVRPAGTHGAEAADPFGDASPYGDASPFGPRVGDPFGPSTTAPFSAVPADAGPARPETERPGPAIGDALPGEATDTRGFLGALFDFGFTSFVTPKVIKVLYMLIVIGTVVTALVFTITVFKASVMFGFLMLVFGDPLFILIALAIYRVILEFFVVTFRVAEDIRALRERGDLH
jgi:hypothetical protein